MKSKRKRVKREHTADDIAEIQDVHVKTVRQWVKDGCPASRSGRKYRFNDVEVDGWLHETNHKTTPGRPAQAKEPVPPELEGNKDYWLARKYKIQCLREERELVNRAEYRAAWMTELATVKNKCRGIGAAMAPQLVGLDAAEIQGRIDERIEQIFRELAEP